MGGDIGDRHLQDPLTRDTDDSSLSQLSMATYLSEQKAVTLMPGLTVSSSTMAYAVHDLVSHDETNSENNQDRHLDNMRCNCVVERDRVLHSYASPMTRLGTVNTTA